MADLLAAAELFSNLHRVLEFGQHVAGAHFGNHSFVHAESDEALLLVVLTTQFLPTAFSRAGEMGLHQSSFNAHGIRCVSCQPMADLCQKSGRNR